MVIILLYQGMQMQRNFLSLLLAIFAVASIAGCGDQPAEVVHATGHDAQTRALSLLKVMTLDEKIQLVHGVGNGASPLDGAAFIPGIKRLGIPDIDIADSSTSVRVPKANATIMPSTLALAASWDPELAHEYGATIGRELRTLGFVEGLGGGINLSREPRGGRTFEYMGEDPVLAGHMVAQRTLGTQEQKVIATLKHYALNNQETNRFVSNSIVDERTMRQLYLLGFEIAVKEGRPGNVMCAYNLVNGVKACESTYLLQTVLKDEWGFDGFVQSDWSYAVRNTVSAANAGLDEEQPGSLNDPVGAGGEPTHFNQRLKAAVETGAVSMARLDDMVLRKLRTMFRVGIMDSPPKPGGRIDQKAGHAAAKKVALGSIVLLKNMTQETTARPILPLDAGLVKKIVVIGGHADVGVMAGGGSGGPMAAVNNPVKCLLPKKMYTECAPFSGSSPFAEIQTKAKSAQVQYFDGKDSVAAVNAAANADVAIIFATQFSGEARDLASLGLPDPSSDPANQAFDQRALIEAVAKKNANTVVVLEHGTAVTMPWLPSVAAVLASWYPGDQGGAAIADILFGDVNPSAKLPMTFPRSEADLPQKHISATDMNVSYSEGLMMGYRWYDAQKIDPLFAFGYGLSYTTFSYTDLRLSRTSAGNVKVNFTLTNTGARAGSEVMQVYAALPGNAGEPPQRLLAWKKVQLAPGQKKNIEIDVALERLKIWSTTEKQWILPKGTYEFRLGNSSRDANVLRAAQAF